ncbi:hypothetical protein B1219_07130 [Pseudomonas ogarae]|nr:hypothetical protein B1219_07130 [Pseudomonas ogarae]OPG76120.1 hypothetical protein B1218_27765 [Pseudomonas ogarae]
MAKGFTLLYVVTACYANNDSTPIPCGPLSLSGANTPVITAASVLRAPPILGRIIVCCATAQRRRPGGLPRHV